LPVSVISWLHTRWYGPDAIPPVGYVDFGSFRRLTPISRRWGYDRGGSIARYYIEEFLHHYASDIRGRVLEIGDDFYIRTLGADRVIRRDILDINQDNPKATIIADLASADHIPSDTFDCIICTQTLHLIDDARAAIGTLHRILKPQGVVLATVAGLSQVRYCDWGGYWCGGFMSARRMFAQVFTAANVQVRSYGNVLAAIAFLEGLGVTELRPEELNYHDPDFEVIISIRAVKTT
jgi:SAM-dependent methyltransferase